MKVQMIPALESFGAKHESGIRRVIEAWAQYLPDYGVELVPPDRDEYDLKAVHAGTAPDCDVAHLHGLYWTHEYQAAAWEWQANATIVDCMRQARTITVPSQWVAETIQRDMHLDPVVIPHGIDWAAWQHDQPNGGWVLWNKNRVGDVCNPIHVDRLAEHFPKVNFLTTFAFGEAPNVHVTGVVPHAQMKQMVCGAAVYLATTKETFGIGILEAMAAGVPVLGLRHGGVVDLVQHGVNGYLARDEAELVAGLNYCLQHRDTLGRNGRELARAYRWDAVAAQVAQVYRDTLAQKRQEPTVAIIIPSYQYADRVGRAIECAIAQEGPYVTDIVVVDDGSDDAGATRAVVERYTARDSRVRYQYQPNQGVAHARNHGIAGVPHVKYVCCLDADDALEPAFIRTCVTALEGDQALYLAYTRLLTVLPDGSESISPWPRVWDYNRHLQRANQVPTCCVFRRAAWQRSGGYRQRYAPLGAGSEDAAFWTAFGAYGMKCALVSEEPLFRYSYQSGRVSGNQDYHEVDWLAWYPWAQDHQHPVASYATPAAPYKSHPARSYDVPTVAVVVPVGPGHERIMVDALDSVEAQTCRDWELIVVNDSGAPLDLTAWPFARLVETDGRTGAGHARNVGAAQARAPFLVFLDADDFLQPTFLARTLEKWQEVGGWIYTDCYILHHNGTTEPYTVSDWDIRKLCFDGLSAVTCLYQTADWRTVGGFDEEHNREDWDFHLRLARAGICGTRVPLYGFTYRHATGQRRDQDVTEDVARLRALYREEELEMGCSGCKKRRAAAEALVLPAGATKADAGYILLEYSGKNKADTTFRGLSGRKYRFGNNEYQRRQGVHPQDAAHFLRMGIFHRVELPPDPEPALVAEARPTEPPPPPPVVLPVAPPAPEPVPTPAPVELVVAAPAPALPDPGDLTVSELKGLTLTDPPAWRELLRREQAGRNRKSAVAWLTEQAAA